MSIIIRDPDGTVRYPFGKTETPQEKIERLEKENEKLKALTKAALTGVAELFEKVDKDN